MFQCGQILAYFQWRYDIHPCNLGNENDKGTLTLQVYLDSKYPLTNQRVSSWWICKGCFCMIHRTSWMGPQDKLSNNPFLVSSSDVGVNYHSSSTFHIARQNTSSFPTLAGRTLHTFLVNCRRISAFSLAFLDLLCLRNSQRIHKCQLHEQLF